MTTSERSYSNNTELNGTQGYTPMEQSTIFHNGLEETTS